MNTYNVTLSDGTKLEGLTSDTCNFISQNALDPSMFEGKLNGVKIEYTGDEDLHVDPVALGIHEHMKLIYCKQFFGENDYKFVLRDYTQEELKEMRLEARLDYLEMMIDD